ncbi:CsbD family protein [Rhodococcus hoagii]|uniref:CsbD-like protein n=4 Tax=Nocardiaceae TaxID=85025 RepID=E9T4U3_RHOHA|nr:CsbD family protein [Prescottella equi]MBU4616314.1 CsbD family protein [Rhodococcus sp. GG48]MCD7052589.1 CsbD family protein [Rhodococcus sp. BH2-1]GBF16845.1 csbD-like protein [Rhodococcus sp. Br-6]AVP66731.1 CsbD family protein [Prescottella equi]EGD22826.1 CsbD-like protein [Prescottella equi ATCC 33707]
MGIGDKAQNKAQDLGGKAKEAAGKATDDEDLKNEGKGDQVQSAVKDAGEKVKDAASTVKDKLTGK